MFKTKQVFIASFVLLNLINWVTLVEIKYGFPQIVKYVLVTVYLSIFLFFGLFNRLKLDESELKHPIAVWFILWSLFLLFSSFLNIQDPLFYQRLFADRFFFIPYLLPVLILFMNFDLDFFKYYVKLIPKFLTFAILLEIYTIFFNLSVQDWLEHMERINIFNIGASFLLLTSHLSKNKLVTYKAIVFYMLYITMALLYGRRGLVINALLLFFIMLYLRLRSPMLNIMSRMKLYFIGILFFLLTILFGYTISSTYAFERGFSKDAFNESRGLVLRDFGEDFKNAHDWLFGRGIEGRVYRSIYAHGDTLDIVEQGYLTLILRGGLLYLIPFILIFLRAIYLGLFEGKNELVKALALILLIHLVMMFYFNLPDFSTYYIFVWISVTVCLNKRMRSYTNKEITQALSV